MEKNRVKLALDIGNGSIKFILAKFMDDEIKFKVLDYLEMPSIGIKKSVVEDPDLLSLTISKGIKQLEKSNGISLNNVMLGISSDKIVSKTGFGYIEFEEKEISTSDIDKLVNLVKDDILLDDEFVIEQEIYNIRINSSGILKNPIGQTGKKIQGNVHLITIKKEQLEPLIKVVTNANLEIEKVYLNASSSAKSTLDQEDRQLGVALIDIGEGITDIAIYKNDKIIYTKSLAIGGMHYVNDIGYILKTSTNEAKEILEKLKLKEITDGKIKTENGEYELEEVKKIIAARTGDLIEFISKTIDESGFTGYLGRGIVLTGGAISIEEIFVEIGNKTEYFIKQVKPNKIEGLEKTEPSMSTVIGILYNKLEIESKETKYKVENKENNFLKKDEKIDSEEKQLEINSITFAQEDFEDEEYQTEEEKENILEKVKNWLSNFI